MYVTINHIKDISYFENKRQFGKRTLIIDQPPRNLRQCRNEGCHIGPQSKLVAHVEIYHSKEV